MTQLNLEATPFIGRRRELSEVRQALKSSRLVTLTGVGGTGKTRLAREVARQLQSELGESVWVVELPDNLDPDLVPLAVAQAMGLRTNATESQVPHVVEAVGDRPALIVLDNCEHLADACRGLVHELLMARPQLLMLTTSRQPLRITGEQVYAVPPLALPDEAVELFVGRATGALPGFRLDDENRPSVTRLCEALEGLPLALELAAARIRVLTPDAMLARLEDRYRLLSRGFLDTPGRQRSLEASVDWSWDLCSDQERLLWARLSVFTGGFSLEAAETVCSGAGLARDDVLDVLADLVDRSLVTRDLAADEPYFRMLETIRQYGVAKLAAMGRRTTWERRHRDWFSARARAFWSAWVGPDQPRLMQGVRRDFPNYQAVLEHACARPAESPRALRMVVDLENYWVVAGAFAEASHWADAALAPGRGTDSERIEALSLCAYFWAAQREFERADARVAEAVTLAERCSDPISTGYLNHGRGTIAMLKGDPAAAVEPLEAAIATFKAAGRLNTLLESMVVLSLCLTLIGRSERARSLIAEALTLTESTGESALRAFALWTLGRDALQHHDLDRAEELQRTSLELRWSLRDRQGVALNLEAMAAIATARSDTTRAGTLLGVAGHLWRFSGASAMAAPYLAAHRDLNEQITAGTRKDRVFVDAYLRGQSLPIEEAITLALSAPAPEPAPARAASPLTAREEEVAGLVGQGMTNQEIADRLFISLRTAQGHVENILRKLGLSSRTQVAAWVLQRQTS